MDDQLIDERIQNLTPEYLDFFGSGFAEEAVEIFSESAGLTGRNKEILQNSFFLYLLFFLDESSTIEFISNNCGLSAEEAGDVFYAFTASLPEGLRSVISLEYNRLNPPEATDKLAEEIAEAERALATLRGLRDTATEVAPAAVTTHQSSQAEILNRPIVAPAPLPEVPRWDSEM
jgi:hypothetical protein